MKKYLLFVPAMLYPYFIVAILFLLFNRDSAPGRIFWEGMNSIENNGLLLLILVLLVWLGCIFSIIIAFSRAVKNKWDTVKLLRMNMIVKLVHIPTYIFLFVLGLVCLMMIFTVGVTVIIVILDAMTIFLSGMISVLTVSKGCTEKLFSPGKAVLFGILGFVYCVDVIEAVILYIKVKRCV